MGKSKKIKLGEIYTDEVSGFTGTATARFEFANGCVRYQVTAKLSEDQIKEGKKPTEAVFDEEQLVEAGGKRPKPTARHGGDRDVRAPRAGA